MIDLKKLQQKIDDLWERETDESLLNWYVSKRFPAFKEILGEGSFEEINKHEFVLQIESRKNKPVIVNALPIYHLDDAESCIPIAA